MKITCHACGAKYAIADEKVRGRRVKVRCKTCSEPIIVDGYAEPPPEEDGLDDNERTHMVSSNAAAAPAPAVDAWSVNLSDTDQRTMSTDELVAAYNAGQLPADTYVWKEGMADWVPVTTAPDLLPYLSAVSDPAAVSAPAYADAYGDPPAAAPEPAYAPYGAAPAAARVEGGRVQGGADLFGNVDSAGSEEVVTSAPTPGSSPYAEPGSSAYDEPKMTGARNENSVLFSLDSLKAGLGPKSAPSSPKASAPKAAETASLDDIMGSDMGSMGNPLFALQQNQALLAAPPPPPEPPPRPVLPSDPALAGSIAPMAAPQSNNKMIIAVGGAVAAIAVIAVIIGVVVVKSGGDSETAKADTAEGKDSKGGKSSKSGSSSTDEKKDEAKSDSEKKDEAKSDSEKKDEPATAGSAGDKKEVSEEDKKRFAEAMKKKEEEAGKKPDEKKDEVTKKEEPSAGLASFNKGAAIAALGAAAAQASGCKRPGGPTGSGRAVVTFATSGRVTSANVSGGSFPGTPVGSCVASVFRRANVPPFGGAPVTVSKSFSIAP